MLALWKQVIVLEYALGWNQKSFFHQQNVESMRSEGP